MTTTEKIELCFSKSNDNLFIIDSGIDKYLTYKDVYSQSLKLATYLSSKKMQKGDKLLVIPENNHAFILLYFACLFKGITVIPINPHLSKRDIALIISKAEPTAIMVNEKFLEKDSRSITSIFADKKVFCLTLTDPIEKLLQCEYISIEALANFNPAIPFSGVDENDIACIVYTSSTSGQPKGVVHRIYNIFKNAESFTSVMGINENNRFFGTMSLGYLGGYYNLLMLPFMGGSSIVLTQAFNATVIPTFWDDAIKYEVNTLWLIPTILTILLKMDRNNKGIDFCKSNVKLALIGTAPLPQNVKKAFEEKYNITLHENYGLSETLFISTKLPGTDQNIKSVGSILPGIQVKILDDFNNQLKQGKTGEIYVKTPYLMNGYYSDEKISDEWFPTGDIGRITDDSEIVISDRKKDIIIRGGINISAVEIENEIYSNPEVIECAVVGIPDELEGESVLAVITLNEGTNLEILKKKIIKSCRDNLSHVKIPGKIIEIPQFPKNHNGKIMKNKLKEWVIEKMRQDGNKTGPHETTSVTSHVFYQPAKHIKDSNEAMSIKFNNLVYEMQQKEIDVIVLSLGEAFFDIPLFKFDNLPFPKLYHYSHSRGTIDLRIKLADYFLKKYNVNFNPEKEIIVTAGSKIAVYMALLSIIEPGDEVIVLEPAWVSYFEQIIFCHGVPVSIPMNGNLYNVEQYLTNRTKAIIINNPNNPTGKLYDLEELTFLYRISQKYKLIIISDEAYSDFVLNDQQFISMGNIDINKTNSLILNSISKNFGISGWRIGYVISNQHLINQILKINQHLITCPATILEYYVETYFDQIIEITKSQIEEVVRKRNYIYDYLIKEGIRVIKGSTTFYLFTSIEDSSLNSEEFCLQLLNNYHIAAVPGIGYGKSCDKFIRLSIGAETMERVIEGIKRIKNLIQKTKN